MGINAHLSSFMAFVFVAVAVAVTVAVAVAVAVEKVGVVADTALA